MYFIGLNFTNKINFKQFVEFWSSCYYDPREKLYAMPMHKTRFSRDDLSKLYEWKNGGKLSILKKKTLRKISSRLKVINRLKSKFNMAVFENEFAFFNATIWKVFLLHVIASDKYPIFDQHVYRAFCFVTKGKIEEIPKREIDKKKFYFDKYVSFFNNLLKYGISPKKLDEALWTFGKFLKTNYAKSLLKI